MILTNAVERRREDFMLRITSAACAMLGAALVTGWLAVINAAIKEGAINLYSATTTRDFLQAGGQANFEKRFGIKIKPLTAELRKLVDRIRTEISVVRVVADIFEGNDQYMLELHKLN